MEKGPKALRKMQSFLHFLAFGFFDHNFGVPRGEQPLGRAPRLGSSGTFLVLFWSQKSTHSGEKPLKQESRRKVAANDEQRLK